MKPVSRQTIQDFFERLGTRYHKEATLQLIGGSALILLGSTRETLDIDYVGDDIQKNDFQIVIDKVASELGLDTEPVPLDRFVPLPEGNENRGIHVGQFGMVNVYVFDPYSIALSKIDRGSDRDLEDLVFLIQTQRINAEEFERILNDALPHAGKFDFNPDIQAHLQELKKRLA
ncbi:MAG: DUF6036 family nucleotidyltransferase [Chloroflexota bacterium]